MARYRFRLETLRRLREIHRDEMRTRLAEGYEAEQILQAQQSAMQQELANASDLQRRLTEGGVVNVNQLLESQRFQLTLQAQLRVLGEQAAKLAEEVTQRRRAVVEADRQVRVLDKLEQRQQSQAALARGRVEAKQFDEIAAVRWGRRTP